MSESEKERLERVLDELDKKIEKEEIRLENLQIRAYESGEPWDFVEAISDMEEYIVGLYEGRTNLIEKLMRCPREAAN